MGTELELTEAWAPSACTLPTVERPLRLAEFDELFATAVEGMTRPEPTTIRFDLAPTPEVAATAAALVTRETGCCSFFTFTLTATAGALSLEVTVSEAQVDVLTALAERAASVRA
jgi:hypothetical protein